MEEALFESGPSSRRIPSAWSFADPWLQLRTVAESSHPRDYSLMLGVAAGEGSEDPA